MLEKEMVVEATMNDKPIVVSTITVNLDMANIYTGSNHRNAVNLTAEAHAKLIELIEDISPDTGRQESWVAFHRSPEDNLEVYIASDNGGVYFLEPEEEQEVRELMDHELYLQFIKDKH